MAGRVDHMIDDDTWWNQTYSTNMILSYDHDQAGI